MSNYFFPKLSCIFFEKNLFVWKQRDKRSSLLSKKEKLSIIVRNLNQNQQSFVCFKTKQENKESKL